MSLFSSEADLALVLAAGVLLVAALGLMFFGARKATRVVKGLEAGQDPPRRFPGGVRWPLPAGLGTTNTSPAFAALDMYPSGLCIKPRWVWLGPFVPSWGALYDEIVLAEHVRRTLRLSAIGSEGVRLQVADQAEPMIFWTSGTDLLLDELEAHGVGVVRDVNPVRFWTNK
jgi:hypothetical protein